MRSFVLALFFSLLLSCFNVFANDHSKDGGTFPDYNPEGRIIVPVKEKIFNFGAMYAFQWAFYFYSQEDTLRKEGSVKNWYTNPLRPRFDKDSFDYNIFKHSLIGNYYYLFYRSRHYSEKDAFFWSFMSSLAFEFTIETATEKPSYQDIYQTPVFGTVVGIGSEKASNYFHSLNTWYGHTLGYLLNPMTLIPQFAREKMAAVPILNRETIGAFVMVRF